MNHDTRTIEEPISLGVTRRCQLTVHNLSKSALTVNRHDLRYGKWIKEPETVQPGKTGGFQAEKNTAHLTGVTGLVQYECGTEAFTIKFDKPRGVAESTIEIEGEHPGLDVRLYGVEKSPELISGIVEVK